MIWCIKTYIGYRLSTYPFCVEINVSVYSFDLISGCRYDISYFKYFVISILLSDNYIDSILIYKICPGSIYFDRFANCIGQQSKSNKRCLMSLRLSLLLCISKQVVCIVFQSYNVFDGAVNCCRYITLVKCIPWILQPVNLVFNFVFDTD